MITGGFPRRVLHVRLATYWLWNLGVGIGVCHTLSLGLPGCTYINTLLIHMYTVITLQPCDHLKFPTSLLSRRQENLHCNGIKSGRLAIAPGKEILKMIEPPFLKSQRISYLPVILNFIRCLWSGFLIRPTWLVWL
jgi:hypothetical protein